jgi:hypothetical protein
MRFLRLFERAFRVIERLRRHLVCRQVIFLAMVRGGNPVSMGGQLVHFSGYLMGVPRHSFLPRPAYTLLRARSGPQGSCRFRDPAALQSSGFQSIGALHLRHANQTGSIYGRVKRNGRKSLCERRAQFSL